MSIIADSEAVPGFAELGVTAFTTTRAVGTFGTNSIDPVNEVMDRWAQLRRELAPLAPRLATAAQVHGARVLTHRGDWRGWLRGEDADGHFAPLPGTAMAVTVADCVPIFVAHPRGAVLVLHSGWRGTVARILEAGLHALSDTGFDPSDAHVHLGPAICGKCYEVSADVFQQLTGRDPGKAAPVDLRAILAERAKAAAVRNVTVSPMCTRCDNDRFFSHRAGDSGRQIGVIIASAFSGDR